MRGGKLVIAVGDGLTAIINRCLVTAILAARHSIGSNVRWVSQNQARIHPIR